MQVNDQVKIVAPGHQYENQAGLVVAQSGELSTVKLDLVETPQEFTQDELQFLGR